MTMAFHHALLELDFRHALVRQLWHSTRSRKAMLNRLTAYVLTSLTLGCLLSGCGSGKLQTKGRLLKNGAAYMTPEGDIVRVMFVPIPEGNERVTDFHVAIFNREEGTFYAAGRDGKGVPPGKYRIAIEHLKDRKDIFKGAFDAQRSPFVREVNSSADEVTIDLAKPG
jgi:hypothetical protein